MELKGYDALLYLFDLVCATCGCYPFRTFWKLFQLYNAAVETFEIALYRASKKLVDFKQRAWSASRGAAARRAWNYLKGFKQFDMKMAQAKTIIWP